MNRIMIPKHLRGEAPSGRDYCRKPDFAFFRSWQNTLVFHGVKQEANCGYESSECTDAKVIICNSKFLEEAPTVFGVFSLIWARI